MLTSGGVFLYLAWAPVLVSFAVFGVVFAATRYVSIGSMTAAVALPVAMVLLPGAWHDPVLIAFGFVTASLIVLRHVPNIRRLRAGTEHRFGRR